MSAKVEPPHDPLTAPGTTTAPVKTDRSMVDLDDVVARPNVSARRRAGQAGVILVVLVVVGLLLHSLGPAQQGTASVPPTFTPIPPTVVIDSNVNFGTLTLNGHALKGAPPFVTHLFHDGENVVTLSAPPFRAQTCRIEWVGGQVTSGDGACTYGSGGSYQIGGTPVTPDAEVTLFVGSSDLPPDLAANAAQVVSQALAAFQPHTTVPAGQYYATGHDSQGHIVARRAATPLAAAVLFSMPPPGTGSFCDAPQLCGLVLEPGILLPTGQRIWALTLRRG